MRHQSKKKLRKSMQRDEFGNLCYQIGVVSGGKAEDDLLGIKPPKNSAEAECFAELERQGWTATKQGWPDFFCVKNNQVCLVEVKPRKSDGLKQNQIAVMGLLSAKGIPCYMWSPDGGFERVYGTISNE